MSLPFVRQNLDGGDFKPRLLKDALCFRPGQVLALARRCRIADRKN